MHLPADMSGSKNAVQAVGSSISYGKRYTAQALLNLTSRGSDDDAKGAGGDGPITEDQFETLQELVGRSGADPEGFTKYMGVASLKEIRAKEFNRAVEALNTKMRKKQ
jgi:glutamate synthase domain-containing protein 1